MKSRVVILGTFVVFLLLVSSVFGQIGFNGIGATVGYIFPEDPIESTIAFGARADLGTIFSPNMTLMAEFLYWSKGYDESELGVDYGWSWSQIHITALTKYSFAQPGADLIPYAGGGLGLVMAKSEWDTNIPGLSGDASETDLAIHLLGGIGYLLSPQMTGYAELRYTLDGADFFGIFVGVMYNLSK